MAQYAYSLYNEEHAHIIDLKDYVLPFCDGDKCYNDPSVKELKSYIENADSIIIASPIYNYNFNSVAKNLIELTGRSWSDKLVGFINSAGGKSSYMSSMYFANILMLDFRCLIIPRFVYADKTNFDNQSKMDHEIIERIQKLVQSSIFLGDKLKK